MVRERLNLIVSTWYCHLERDHFYHARDNKGLGFRHKARMDSKLSALKSKANNLFIALPRLQCECRRGLGCGIDSKTLRS